MNNSSELLVDPVLFGGKWSKLEFEITLVNGRLPPQRTGCSHNSVLAHKRTVGLFENLLTSMQLRELVDLTNFLKELFNFLVLTIRSLFFFLSTRNVKTLSSEVHSLTNSLYNDHRFHSVSNFYYRSTIMSHFRKVRQVSMKL